MPEEPRLIKTWKMTAKGRVPRSDGSSGERGTAGQDVLDRELRSLYAQYGAGEIPERILDLAKRVEDANRDVRFSPADGATDSDRDE